MTSSPMVGGVTTRDQANALAVQRLCSANPVLVGIQPAIEVVPGMTPTTVLTSGAQRSWEDYTGGQRNALIGGALFEGLASDPEDADRKFRNGTIRVASCHEHNCVGSVAGIYTSSMPVFVVENTDRGNRAFCNLFEGPSRLRLNYGVYNEEVRANLLFLQDVVAPVLGEAVRRQGGVQLKPIMVRALHMGDELHSRNTAATLLFQRELFTTLLDMERDTPEEIRQTLNYLRSSDYFFLRLSMASAKATANAAHGIAGSSVLTAMLLSCCDFAIRVSGLGEELFIGPLPTVEAKLFEGFTESDIHWMGGESQHAELVGLGAFAQAAAFPLQGYQGGSAEAMVQMNLSMYEVAAGEHADFRIPYFGFRGAPVGIDVRKVVATGVVPLIDAGLAGRDGGQIGAGVLKTPMVCFEAAWRAYVQRYGEGATQVPTQAGEKDG